MSQTYTDDCFAGSHEAQTDLQNMENNFAALKSSFSGASAPSNTVAGMPWFDTAKKVLKGRNAADSAWVGLMHGDTSQKVWIYRNAAMDGWAVDSGVTDRVLALKGGTTYTAGAATAGSWTLSGFTDGGHTHAAGSFASPNHTHTLATAGVTTGDVAGGPVIKDTASGGLKVYNTTGAYPAADFVTGNPSATALTGTSASGTASITHDGSSRPAAAVGTLQYLDL